MKTNHTKRQWTQGTNTASIEWMQIFCNGKVIAEAKPLSKKGERNATDFAEEDANAKLIAHAPELLVMVNDLKNCIKRLTNDDLDQSEKDLEAYWIGEAHELLSKINPDYYTNANA